MSISKLYCWVCGEEKINLSYPHNKDKRKPNYYNPDLITQANHSPFRKASKNTVAFADEALTLYEAPFLSRSGPIWSEKPWEVLQSGPSLEAVSFATSFCFVSPRNVTVCAPAEWAAEDCSLQSERDSPSTARYSAQPPRAAGKHARESQGHNQQPICFFRVMSSVQGGCKGFHSFFSLVNSEAVGQLPF